MLKAGAAEVVITPPVGVELAGYGFGPSVGILDQLAAQALVLESTDASLAIVTADLLTFGSDLLKRVRERVAETLGIPGDHVVLSASHTHSGPTAMPLRGWGMVDEAYVRALESRLVGAIALGQGEAREARVGLGTGRVTNISENRRGVEGLLDPTVPVLRIDDVGGEPLTLLHNFGCHPVSLHSYRNLISPDYPGYARRVVRDVLGERIVVMFTLGAAGDINPAGYVAGKTTPERSRQIGAILGCEVAKVALDARTFDEPVVRVGRTVVELPVAHLPSPSELRDHHERHAREAGRLRAAGRPWPEVSVAEIRRDWTSEALEAWESGKVQRTVSCELQAVRIGAAAIVACPLEMFTGTGLAIKQASPAEATMICTNSNGGVGYLPTHDAYEANDYTNPQGLAPKVYGLYALASGAESVVRQAAVELLKRLF